MGADWNAMRPWLRTRSHRLWSRFPAEVRPDTILTPLLFLEGPREERDTRDQDRACTLPHGGLVVMHGRGERHLRFLRDEVAPLLESVPLAFLVDADARTLHPARDPGVSLPLERLPSILRSTVSASAADAYAEGLDQLTAEQASALEELPTREEVETYLHEAKVIGRIADAAARAEAAPLRLWEAMLWRGWNYRWELVAGEIPLVGELWSPLAANRTLVQCVEDAERAFSERASDERGWIRCGPMRMQQTGTQVEIRFRPGPADRRAAFLPAARMPGDEGPASLWGALVAGGGSGKTEMMASYTESVIEVGDAATAEVVAQGLAAEIVRCVGAQVVVRGETDDQGAWPERAGSAWHVYHRERYVSVLMPMGRDDHLPWDVQSGLHLSDDFMMSRFRTKSSTTGESIHQS